MVACDRGDQSREITSHPRDLRVLATDPVPENKSSARRVRVGDVEGLLAKDKCVQEDLGDSVSSGGVLCKCGREVTGGEPKSGNNGCESPFLLCETRSDLTNNCFWTGDFG